MRRKLSENQKDLLLALDHDGDRVYKAEEITEVMDVTRRSVYNILNELIEKDLVKKVSRGKYQLAEDGRTALESIERPAALVKPEVQDKNIKDLEDVLPSGAHVAFFELTISTIFAKQNLFDEYDKGWPGFILYGPTKTYKTGLGEDILKTVGIEPAEAVKNLETAAPGEISIRHDQAKGKGYKPETSYVLNYPAFVFDEYDKARSTIKDKVRVYLQSKSSDVVEDEKVSFRTVPIVTLNTDEVEKQLTDPFIRRSFLLDTSRLNVQEDIDLKAQRIKQYLQTPLCDPNKPAEVDRLGDVYESVRELYKPFVTSEFWNNQADLRPVEIALKGRRLSPLSTGELERDLVDNGFRVLQLAATRGKTVKNWRTKFAEKAKEFTGSEGLQEAFEVKEKEVQRKKEEAEKRKKEQKEKEDQARQERINDREDKYGLILDKEAVIAKLEGLRDALYPLGQDKANRDARPTRKMVDSLIEDLKAVETRRELEEFAETFRKVKQKKKFKKGVKVALRRRAFDTNDLKFDVCNWDYFLNQEEIEDLKSRARESTEEKEPEGGSQTEQVPENTEETPRSTSKVPSPEQLAPPVSYLLPQIQEEPEEPADSPPEPKDPLLEIIDQVLPWRDDYEARAEKFIEQKKAEIEKHKERIAREKQNTHEGGRHGTPAEDLATSP
ncbi:hypothetical protein KGY71_01370 [Candidatus Bipolaricaulota bacterium]|nr:hypothetical protein [Candidatus Bipolaricaulota bacterium]